MKELIFQQKAVRKLVEMTIDLLGLTGSIEDALDAPIVEVYHSPAYEFEPMVAAEPLEKR